MTRLHILRSLALFVLLWLACIGAAFSQSYPSRPTFLSAGVGCNPNSFAQNVLMTPAGNGFICVGGYPNSNGGVGRLYFLNPARDVAAGEYVSVSLDTAEELLHVLGNVDVQAVAPPPSETLISDITVADLGGGTSYGYFNGVGGSANPDPSTAIGVTVSAIYVDLFSSPERLYFSGLDSGQILTAMQMHSTVRVEYSGGTVDFDTSLLSVPDPSSVAFEADDYPIIATLWGAGDVGLVRSVSFAGTTGNTTPFALLDENGAEIFRVEVSGTQARIIGGASNEFEIDGLVNLLTGDLNVPSGGDFDFMIADAIVCSLSAAQLLCDGGFVLDLGTGDMDIGGDLGVTGDLSVSGTISGSGSGLVFGCTVDANATVENCPTGWSVARTGAGAYTVTHNLGLSAGAVLPCVPGILYNGANHRIAMITGAPGQNSFNVGTFDDDNGGGGTQNDNAFQVLCTRVAP